MPFPKFVLSITFLVTTAGAAWSCPADYDPSFGDGGIALSDLAADRVAFVSDSVIASDGSILLAGFVRTAGFWDPTPTIFRLTAGGQFDGSFGDGGLAQLDEHASFSSIALDDGGSIVAQFDVYDGNDAATAGVARFDEDGNLDVSFGDGGRTILDRGGHVVIARDVLVRSDGVILVAGQERIQPFEWQAHVYAFSPGGDFESAVELDNDAPDVATSLVEVDDGAVMVGGMFTGALSRAQTFLARLTADSVPDTSFAGDGTIRYPTPAAHEEAWRIGEDAEGRIYAAGNLAPNLHRRRTVVFVRRMLASGEIDETYGRNGTARIPLRRRVALRGLAVSDDGEATVAGYFTNGRAAIVARFDSDGRRDRTFGSHGLLRVNVEFGTTLTSVNLQDDGGIVATGSIQFDALAIRLEGGDADGAEACQIGCGDGVRKPWEECDDGNTATGDGCNALCQHE